jgi:hypothetical protein
MATAQAAGGGGGRELELLKGITGAFRPGVLTALMGATKTLAHAASRILQLRAAQT